MGRPEWLTGWVLLLALGAHACGKGEIETRPTETDPLFKARMAQSLMTAGRTSEALATLQEAVDADPDNPSLHLMYGQFCFRSGRFAEAEAALRRALARDAYLTDAHNLLGAVYQEQGRFADAEAEYRRALEDRAYPTPEKVYLNLGLLFIDQGRDVEAIEMLRRSVEIVPKFYKAHFELAAVLDRVGNLREAAREYEVAAPAYRGIGEYFYRLGFTYFRLGDRGRALENLSRVAVVAPGSQSAAKADELLRILE